MSIDQWPQNDRPRERLIQSGPESLSDSELLAIFLRTGIPGKSAVDLARELIGTHGGLKQLSRIRLDQWLTHKGLGNAKFAQFKACIEMARRCLSGELQDEACSLDSPVVLERFVRAQIGLSEIEQFLVIALNSHLQVINHRVFFSGTVNKTAVFPREVLKYAVQTNAPRLMVAHNHPSNRCEPSQADLLLTKDLHQALRLVDIELVDHLIVGPSCSLSMRTKGFTPFA